MYLHILYNFTFLLLYHHRWLAMVTFTVFSSSDFGIFNRIMTDVGKKKMILVRGELLCTSLWEECEYIYDICQGLDLFYGIQCEKNDTVDIKQQTQYIIVAMNFSLSSIQTSFSTDRRLRKLHSMALLSTMKHRRHRQSLQFTRCSGGTR